MSISTHILDTTTGRPAAGVRVHLERRERDETWSAAGGGVTDTDGRIGELTAGPTFSAGTYRLTFETGAYFVSRDTKGFYPFVQIVFRVRDAEEHHHVPLLLNPYGYSTYRGS